MQLVSLNGREIAPELNGLVGIRFNEKKRFQKCPSILTCDNELKNASRVLIHFCIAILRLRTSNFGWVCCIAGVKAENFFDPETREYLKVRYAIL